MLNGKKLLVTGMFAASLIAAASFGAVAAEGKRIAFFVSDLSNVFHQS